MADFMIRMLQFLHIVLMLDQVLCDTVENKEKAKYVIAIQTAKAYVGAGGKNNLVVLEMTGEDGRVTGPIELNRLGDDKFRKGQIDEFKITADDVGPPMLLRFELAEHTESDPWGIASVDVTYKDETTTQFPVHDWVVRELRVPNGQAFAYHQMHNRWMKSEIKREVDHSRDALPWVRLPGPTDRHRSLPRFADADVLGEMPLMFQRTEQQAQSFLNNSVATGVMRSTVYMMRNRIRLNSLDKFHYVYHPYEDKRENDESLSGWDTDEQFGRDLLNGLASNSLERCTKIPKSSQITGNHVIDLLEGKTLEEQMKAGKIYMMDFTEIVRDVNRNNDMQGKDIYTPNAICISFVNSKDDLVPIAIQLVPGDENTIFTPMDSEHDWLLAKMYFKTVMNCVHEWYHHFVLTHGVIESFLVAVFRNLPRNHPVYKLLWPHLRSTPPINIEARNTLIWAGTPVNMAFGLEGEDTARKLFANFDIDDLRIPNVLKKRGLDDPKLLPKFYYRDDILRIWKMIEQYVKDVLENYYKDDEDVVADKFLQEFNEDIVSEGIGYDDENKRKGLIDPITTLEELFDLCVIIIGTASAQHAAVNFPQYQHYKYAPANPLGMREPEHRKGEADMERIIGSLPDITMATINTAVGYSLVQSSPDEPMLGNFPIEHFTEEGPKIAMKNFKKQLDLFAEQVKKRNENVENPYELLLPGLQTS